MIQLYWHFKRLMDIGLADDPISQSGVAAEVVAFGTTVEHLSNAILNGRGVPPRGQTLMTKIRSIVSPVSAWLAKLTIEHKKLTHTEQQTLKARIAQIDRLTKKGGQGAPVLRALLKLVVIRNEGSHLGLSAFDRDAIYKLLESLVQVTLILGKLGNDLDQKLGNHPRHLADARCYADTRVSAT